VFSFFWKIYIFYEILNDLFSKRDNKNKIRGRVQKHISTKESRANQDGHHFKYAEMRQIEAPGAKRPWWRFR
jgi:hypothetical protein